MATTESGFYSDDTAVLQDLAERLKLTSERGDEQPIRTALLYTADRFGEAAVAPIERVLAWRLHTLATMYAATASTQPSRAEAVELERLRAGGGASS